MTGQYKPKASRTPSATEVFVRRAIARGSVIIGVFSAYIFFGLGLISGFLLGLGENLSIALSALFGILIWWFSNKADRGLPPPDFGLLNDEPNIDDTDISQRLAPSVFLRVVLSKLAIPLGISVAIGVTMLLWDFDGNVRRRGGFHRGLVSIFGQEGTAIIFGLMLGLVVGFSIFFLDEHVKTEDRQKVRGIFNLKFVQSENYIKFVLTGILVVLIVIAVLLWF